MNKNLDTLVKQTIKGIKRLKLQEIYLLFISLQLLLIVKATVPFTDNFIFVEAVFLIAISYIIVIFRGEKR